MSLYQVVQSTTIHGILHQDGSILDTNATSALTKVGTAEAKDLVERGYLRPLNTDSHIVSANGPVEQQAPYVPGRWTPL